jgi:hypothetical protein
MERALLDSPRTRASSLAMLRLGLGHPEASVSNFLQKYLGGSEYEKAIASHDVNDPRLFQFPRAASGAIEAVDGGFHRALVGFHQPRRKTIDLRQTPRRSQPLESVDEFVTLESGYTPTVFFRMIEQYGGVETAHRLLKPDADFFSYGFEHLCRMKRDDLTMESLILSLDYKNLIFSDRELAIAAERLAAARQLVSVR